MKTNIAIIFLMLFTTITTLSQTNVDNIGGFKGIKIGDNFKKWEQSLHNKQSRENETRYLLKNSCCTHIYNYEIENIYLVFEDNILKSITITTDWFTNPGVWRDTEFTEIKDELENVFGQATGFFTPTNSQGNVTWYWKGEVIYMQSEYDWHGSLSPSRVIISIADNNYLEKYIK